MTDYDKAIDHFGNAVGELAKGRAYIEDVDLEDDADLVINDLEYFLKRIERNRPEKEDEE